MRGLWTMSMAAVIKSIEREALREAQSQELCGDISGGYSTKTPCIGKDDSIPEWLRKNVEKKLRDYFEEREYENNRNE